MSELLPCPFCNGGNVDLATLAGKFCVQCSECEASGPWVDKPSLAIDAWNHRAALAAQPGAVALTDEQIKRHSLLAADCPGASTVILVSSLRRLLSAAPTEAKPAQQDAVDAERYRYLRDFYSPPSDEPWDNMDCALAHGGEELDALIDAAISAKKVGV